ncbi:XRE family transcriptional regulator [Exiguobacterium sp. SH3S2]|uniref:helix-turn-helix domain-containing protein n=1 Tax=Exiguobacterium TaxID=33986 RepID=UPI0003535FC4|nr:MULTISPECIES: helix-turn-helix transcriptional regulator [Exiguobacterium]EPE62075.1 helix-turn-helix family protein [Exiguobacterium sp. S17]TCI27226.1 XRE family transcriptional regulator [Exiguobacterium sp. SH5S4]TCI39240.1 XRE family transcriptional regulator [Exiguobacterium sp. SH4S7]TCI46058.1 XRE family transcriptional regulator [Exiguobacterium sp. SH3S3]TCI48076.1 XRE family transcriptional regulator [Exiguobacterium sp. SH5S32]
MDGKNAPYRGYGDRIRILRERTGISIEALAEQIGVAPYFIRRTELSEVYPTMPYIEALAEALKIDANYLARHIWTGESLKVLMKGKAPELEQMKLAYEEAMHGKSTEDMQHQLETRMRIFDLMHEEELRRIFEEDEEPTSHHALEALVDAVLDLGRTHEATHRIVPFARYVDQLVPEQFVDNSFQYTEFGIVDKSYKLQ